jgi:PTH1 family peptidyl-tRNA hydrolase
VILVVGLGNPGARYESTRHNVGFQVVDRLVSQASAAFRARFEGQFAQIEIAGRAVGLLKPETFMNESGRSVQPAVSFYKVQLADVLVIHDELDLPLGDVRLKLGGSDAGHRGIRSVTQLLGSDQYLRLRVGIGRPPPDFRGSVRDFVLQGASPTESPELERALEKAVGAVRLVTTDGLAAAMNQTNQRPR